MQGPPKTDEDKFKATLKRMLKTPPKPHSGTSDSKKRDKETARPKYPTDKEGRQ